MAAAETQLWDHFDACGIDFRLPMYRLVDRFGARASGWSDGLSYCEPKAHAPFLPHLAHSPVFQFLPDTDMGAAPPAFFTYIREADTTTQNFALARKGLQALFGEGCDTSASNTVSRSWKLGFARIDAIVYPPKLNTQFGANDRHRLIPGSETECAITIRAAWREPMNTREKGWAEDFQQLYAEPVQDPNAPPNFPLVNTFTRDWPKNLPPARVGFGMSKDGAALLLFKHARLVEFLLTSWITAISRNSLTAARGPAEAEIVVHFLMAGQEDLTPQSLWLAKHVGDPTYFDTLAADLAEKINVPLHKHQQPNT